MFGIAAPLDGRRAARGDSSCEAGYERCPCGAHHDAFRAMPEILRQNNAELEARIVDRIRRGFYDLNSA